MLRTWMLTALALAIAPALQGQEVPIPAPPQLGVKGYILIDHATGDVIAESNPDEILEPASLTKLMTAYTVFKALGDGQVNLDDEVRVSERAWGTEGSRTFIELGTAVSVEDLLQGMIVQSGNDASVALAEHVAGTEAVFADLMNFYADQLGMESSSFRNSTGLPDPDHYMTARDAATIARAIITEFPEYYMWYSQRQFTYNEIEQFNRNSLLWRDESVDGLKTGYTEAAGYCLVTSAERSGMRLVSVVMGSYSAEARANDSQALLNYGFRFFETYRLYSGGDEVTTARVWKGESDSVALGVAEDHFLTIPKGRYDSLNSETTLDTELTAPIEAGATLGTVTISMNDEELAVLPLVALTDVGEAGLWERIKDEISLWFE
ncbi:MAG: D-alanyl-D-alanine carboxypeptidase [Gammaproteobacteria bacterium]|nr:D-alanyl-D-alanine carboxypeptidase [Gammaproteobacteria bacterium]